MRRLYLLYSVLGFSLAGGIYFFDSFDMPKSQQEMERNLRLQTRDFASSISSEFKNIEKTIEDNFKAQKVSSNMIYAFYEPAARKLLSAGSMPPGLKVALIKQSKEKNQMKLWSQGKHSVLIWTRKISDKTVLVGLDANKLFRPFRVGKFTQPFIATKEGQVIFYSSRRYMGTSSSNVRPIALAQKHLQSSARVEQVAAYQGISGQSVKGAWITLPELDLVAGLEWPNTWWAGSNVSAIAALCFVLSLISAFFVGLAITPRPVLVQAVKKQVKDLDPESRAIVEEAILSANTARNFALQKDEEIEELQSKARKEMAKAQRQLWEVQNLESFLDQLSELKAAKSVWHLLAEQISKMSLHAPVVVYQYSPASFTLVPSATINIDEFPKSAQNFLMDARILIGDVRLMQQFESTQALANWEAKRLKHMPGVEDNIIWIPFFSRFGTSGVVAIYVNSEMNFDQTLAKQKEFWQTFADRAAWMYDVMKPSVKSKLYVAGSTSTVEANNPSN